MKLKKPVILYDNYIGIQDARFLPGVYRIKILKTEFVLIKNTRQLYIYGMIMAPCNMYSCIQILAPMDGIGKGKPLIRSILKQLCIIEEVTTESLNNREFNIIITHKSNDNKVKITKNRTNYNSIVDQKIIPSKFTQHFKIPAEYAGKIKPDWYVAEIVAVELIDEYFPPLLNVTWGIFIPTSESWIKITGVIGFSHLLEIMFSRNIYKLSDTEQLVSEIPELIFLEN